MSRYNEDLDYLIRDVDISKAELEEIIVEADKIISDKKTEKDKLIEAYLKKVQCLQKLDKYAESKEFIDKLLTLKPNMPEALVRLGKFYYTNKEYKDALPNFNKAIDNKPNYTLAYYYRGWVYFNMGQYNDAIDDAKRIENKEHFEDDAFFLWATALSDLAKNNKDEKLFKDSFEKYAEATTINPKNDSAFRNWKISLDEFAELKEDKEPFKDSDVKSAYNDYNTSILYAAYERLYFVMDSNRKDPDFDKEVKNFVQVNGTPIGLAEYYLLMSSAEYLYYEAPLDEQNLFMVIELINAGKKDYDYDGYESDLDRLFEMLKEKDANHIAVRHYEKFRSNAGKMTNVVIESCRKRFSAIGNSGNIFKYIDKTNNNTIERDIKILAKIILRTFAKDKLNSLEFYEHLKALYYNSQTNKSKVKVSDIDIKLYHLENLEKFYEESYSEEDEEFEEEKIEEKQNLEPREKKSTKKPEEDLKYDLQLIKDSPDSTREILKKEDYDKLIEECKTAINNLLTERRNAQENVHSDEESIRKVQYDIKKNDTNLYSLFISCGDAFLFKAVKESDENKKKQYYKECFEQYTKASKYSNDFQKEYNKILGIAYMYRGCDDDLNKAANYFSTANVDISILPKFKNKNAMNVAKVMLDKDIFFQETTKEFSEDEKDKYKEIYIISLEIISELQVPILIKDKDEKIIVNEMPVSYYTKKNVSENLLFGCSYFRLNSINTSNDPKEGITLLYYLFDIKDEEEKMKKNIEFPPQIEEEFGAFAACFILNNDSLNQFRLYGKTDEKEGTGVSISLNADFFSEKISNCIKMESEAKNKDKGNTLPLFRCIYIDPKTAKIVSLGQKEECVFYRENKTEEEYNRYKKEIENKKEIISSKLEILKKNIKDWKLDTDIVHRLLLNLRYLVKHAAFKEEQECRIVKIKKLTDGIEGDPREREIQPDENNRLYVNYLKLNTENVAKICYGPKVTDKDIEIFEQLFVHNGNKYNCKPYKSTAPLA